MRNHNLIALSFLLAGHYPPITSVNGFSEASTTPGNTPMHRAITSKRDMALFMFVSSLCCSSGLMLLYFTTLNAPNFLMRSHNREVKIPEALRQISPLPHRASDGFCFPPFFLDRCILMSWGVAHICFIDYFNLQMNCTTEPCYRNSFTRGRASSSDIRMQLKDGSRHLGPDSIIALLSRLYQELA